MMLSIFASSINTRVLLLVSICIIVIINFTTIVECRNKDATTSISTTNNNAIKRGRDFLPNDLKNLIDNSNKLKNNNYNAVSKRDGDADEEQDGSSLTFFDSFAYEGPMLVINANSIIRFFDGVTAHFLTDIWRFGVQKPIAYSSHENTIFYKDIGYNLVHVDFKNETAASSVIPFIWYEPSAMCVSQYKDEQTVLYLVANTADNIQKVEVDTQSRIEILAPGRHPGLACNDDEGLLAFTRNTDTSLHFVKYTAPSIIVKSVAFDTAPNHVTYSTYTNAYYVYEPLTSTVTGFKLDQGLDGDDTRSFEVHNGTVSGLAVLFSGHEGVEYVWVSYNELDIIRQYRCVWLSGSPPTCEETGETISVDSPLSMTVIPAAEGVRVRSNKATFGFKFDNPGFDVRSVLNMENMAVSEYSDFVVSTDTDLSYGFPTTWFKGQFIDDTTYYFGYFARLKEAGASAIMLTIVDTGEDVNFGLPDDFIILVPSESIKFTIGLFIDSGEDLFDGDSSAELLWSSCINITDANAHFSTNYQVVGTPEDKTMTYLFKGDHGAKIRFRIPRQAWMDLIFVVDVNHTMSAKHIHDGLRICVDYRFPHFGAFILYDPDVSVLYSDSGDDDENKDWIIAAIVVPIVVGVAVLVVLTVIVITVVVFAVKYGKGYYAAKDGGGMVNL